jgi:hypothetical protein
VIAALLALLVGAVPVTVLPRPSFPAPTQGPSDGRRLVLVSSRPAPIGSMSVRFRHDVFRGLPLVGIAGTLKIYGRDTSSGRYVVAPGRYAFDFAKYAWPPKYVSSDREFVYEQLVWAKEWDGVLYVQTSHSTYAKSSYGLNGYVNAIDLKTRNLLWRSPALVANADNFVIAGKFIVSGYGFTAESDYLYLLDRGTGHILDRLPLPSAPEFITRSGRTFFVNTYDHNVVARLTS